MEAGKKKLIIDELYEVIKSKEVTFAEAQEILNALRNKLYASAKIQ